MAGYRKTQLTRDSLHEGLSELSKHVDCDELVVIGAGAIAQFVEKSDDQAAKFSYTEDIDVCLTRDKKYPEKGEDLFCEESKFHDDKGYYIQLLDDFFYSKLENGWKERAAEFKTENGKTFHILSPLDIASNKILVGRHKDFDAVNAMIKDNFLDREKLRALQNNLANEQPKLANQISLVSAALDLRLDRCKQGFAEKLATFAEKNRAHAKTFDLTLGILGIPLPGDDPIPPAMKAAEKHFDEKRINAKTLIERLERFAPSATQKALARNKPKKSE